VAATLNVSTTPVREALRDLATEGLITLDRHRGGTVRELDWDDMEEIGMVREALDPLAVRLFCERITDEQLREAESLWRQMEKQKGEASTKDSQLHAQLEKYDGAYTACLTRRGYTVK
jgi:DNA-binding GntR family transcriptional regulator